MMSMIAPSQPELRHAFVKSANMLRGVMPNAASGLSAGRGEALQLSQALEMACDTFAPNDPAIKQRVAAAARPSSSYEASSRSRAFSSMNSSHSGFGPSESKPELDDDLGYDEIGRAHV